MRVAFLERMVPDYRTRLFDLLHERFARCGIDFVLVTGQSQPGEDLKEMVPVGSWVRKIHNVYLNRQVFWPCFGGTLDDVDLVIMHPQNAHLGNFRLMLRRRVAGRPKIAFFGHGGNINLRVDPGQLPWQEKFKARIAEMADWWFPYTDMSVRVLAQRGIRVPKERMTVVNNTIDTVETRRRLAKLPVDIRERIRGELGIATDDKVGFFCGRLQQIKLSFLFEATDEIRRLVPNFQLVIIGKGAETDAVSAFAGERSWVHFLGAKYGDERLPYFAASDVFVMPGLVGLAILDAFSAGLPLCTTACGVHSPEIEYLQNGENGIQTDSSAMAFAVGVAGILNDPQKIASMAERARRTAEQVTMEAMADNFDRGVRGCLGLAAVKE